MELGELDGSSEGKLLGASEGSSEGNPDGGSVGLPIATGLAGRLIGRERTRCGRRLIGGFLRRSIRRLTSRSQSWER
jgi:hypothetical protein